MHRWKVAYFRVPHRAHVISISSKHRASMPTRNRSTSLPPLTFEDHNRAFRHKSTWEIVRALAVLRACSLQPLVDNSLKLMKWVERTGGEACLRLLLKRTLYEQFVGGETPRELRQCVSKVSGAGMRCMLAATMEEDIGQERRAEEVYQGNCGRILEAIQLSSDTCPSPMIQLKLSGLLPARLLMQVGDLFSASKLRAVEAIGDQLVGNSIRAFQESLGRRDQVSLERALRRLKEICEEARRKNVRVLVDAECTHLNEGLSALAMGAAAAFNSDVPVVWNTYQCYLKKANQRIREEMGLLRESVDVCFGAKLVRGAYMLQERQRAQQMGLPDPICADYSATSANYDKVSCFLLDRSGPRCHFIAATHNEESIRLVIHRMEDEKADRRFVSFGQLYGMCDQISNPLAERGFAVYKSVPYGTLPEVLPYLARRALENKGVLKGARKEHALLVKELKTRLLHRGVTAL